MVTQEEFDAVEIPTIAEIESIAKAKVAADIEEVLPSRLSTVELRAAFVPLLGPANGTADAAWINAKIAGGGYFRGNPGATYLLESRLIVPSNTHIDFTGCTLQFKQTLTSGNLCTNYSQANPKSVGGVTANVGDTTFYSDTPLRGQVSVGDNIVIFQAGVDGIPLTAIVTAVNSSTSVTIDRPIAKAVTNTTARVYGTDHDITIQGGVWNRGAVGGYGAVEGHGLNFRFVQRLHVDIDEYHATAGTYALCVAAVWDYKIGCGWMDNKSLDGLHVMGPAYDGECTRLAGNTNDDSLALLCADAIGPLTDVAGDIIGFTWNIVRTQAEQSIVKIMSGPGLTIGGIRGGITQGTYKLRHAVWIGEDLANPGVMKGNWGTIDVGIIDAAPVAGFNQWAPLGLHSPNAGLIKATIRSKSPLPRALVDTAGSTPVVIRRLDLELDALGPVPILLATNTNMTIDSMDVRGRYDQVSGSLSPMQISAGAWNDIDSSKLTSSLTARTLIAASGTGSYTERSPKLIIPFVGMLNPNAGAWSAANRAVFDRFTLITSTTLRYVNWIVSTQSGNVQVGIVKLAGVGHGDYTVVMDSGVIPCPAAGNICTDLGAKTLPPGDYAVFLWADNATFQTRAAGASGLAALRVSGSLDGLGTGVQATGNFSYGTLYFAATVEADV